jgi:putative FmdB family regulatory protein
MPIYEYRCESCGHQQEFLQKVSDAPITVCTGCGKPTFSKMVTAAGFQLKGSGWYATDFKNGGSKPKSADKPSATSSEAPKGDAPKSEAPKGDAPASSGGEKKASSGGCGGGCSCH